MRCVLIVVLCWCQGVAASGLSDPLLQRTGSWGQPYADQWGLFSINAILRENDTTVRSVMDTAALLPVVVAVIDTGVDYRHPICQRSSCGITLPK